MYLWNSVYILFPDIKSKRIIYIYIYIYIYIHIFGFKVNKSMGIAKREYILSYPCVIYYNCNAPGILPYLQIRLSFPYFIFFAFEQFNKYSNFLRSHFCKNALSIVTSCWYKESHDLWMSQSNPFSIYNSKGRDWSLKRRVFTLQNVVYWPHSVLVRTYGII